MQALVSMSIGFFIATGAPTLQIAQILGPMINVIFIIFGGSFVNSDTIPKWVGWLQWISTIRYSYGGLIQNEFYGTTFECPTGRPCAFPNGEVVVEFYGLSNPGIWACVAILAGMVAFYQLAAALMLRVTTKPNFILI
jgi:ABC-type multidrug transport system permease subunit